jgi:hypothetical protein
MPPQLCFRIGRLFSHRPRMQTLPRYSIAVADRPLSRLVARHRIT